MVRHTKTSDLPTWSSDQIKLVSQLASELSMPLAFMQQVNDVLLSDSLEHQNHKLLSGAQRQLDHYLNIIQSMELLRTNLSSQTSLVPINPTAIAQIVAGSVRPRLHRDNHRLQIYSDERAVALGNGLALENILKALIKLSEMTSERASQMNLEVVSRAKLIQIRLTSSHSSLTRAQVKNLIQHGASWRQPLVESSVSALPIILAQELSHGMNGRLDFNRLRGRASWTLSLLKSQQLTLWS